MAEAMASCSHGARNIADLSMERALKVSGGAFDGLDLLPVDYSPFRRVDLPLAFLEGVMWDVSVGDRLKYLMILTKSCLWGSPMS